MRIVREERLKGLHDESIFGIFRADALVTFRDKVKKVRGNT